MQISGAGVYLIHADGTRWRVKIGVTTNIRTRLAELQVGSPLKLDVIGWAPGATRILEQRLHREFDAQRLHGEWFDFDDLTLEAVRHRLGCGYLTAEVRALPPKRITGSRTLGRCELCQRNVQATMKFVARPRPGRGRRGRKPAFRHVDCKNPYLDKSATLPA